MVQITSRWLILFAVLVLGACMTGCGGDEAAPPSMDADPPEVKAVRMTMKEGSWERTLRAATTPNPKGDGTVVQMGNAKYLVKGGSVFAINVDAKSYSPSVPAATGVKSSDIKLSGK